MSRKLLIEEANCARGLKREYRFHNPSAKFPVSSWTDFYGETIVAGDKIKFFTLYGYRIAQVLEIEEDIDYRATEYCSLTPVVFVIEPFVERGFEGIFRPCSRISSESTYDPCKWIGRKRSKLEINMGIARMIKRFTDEDANKVIL